MPRTLVVAIRFLISPSTAGSRVIEPAITIETVIAADSPKPATNGSPMSSRPSSDTTTVAPAKTTERPAESSAAPTASSGPKPLRTHSR